MDRELEQQANARAEICGLFGNPTRLLILWTLSEEEHSVGDIAGIVGASLQNTSQHLRLMRDKGLLVSRREGNTVYYGLQRDALPLGCLWRDGAPASESSLTTA
jgi:ArsR family transcriptional regulator